MEQNKTKYFSICIDDDPVFCKLIEDCFEMKALSFGSVSEFVDWVGETSKDNIHPFAIFLDIHLRAGENGLSFIPQIRAMFPAAPIIVVSADKSPENVGKSLTSGAADFVFKPTMPEELRARVNARRFELQSRLEKSVLAVGDLELSLVRAELKGPKGSAHLSHKEKELLAYLFKTVGTMSTKDELKRVLWGGASISDGALYRRIFEIRKAVTQTSRTMEIKSFYGKGVALRSRDFAEDQLLIGDMQTQADLKGS